MKKCEYCSKDFIPLSDRDVRFIVCSNPCRAKMYHIKNDKILIQNGEWHNMSIKRVEQLGFKVTITKVCKHNVPTDDECTQCLIKKDLLLD